MASQTVWTWVWASSRRWWWTGKPGMLQSLGLQRVGHNWATEITTCACNPSCVPLDGKSFGPWVALHQQSSSFLSVGTGFMGDDFSGSEWVSGVMVSGGPVYYTDHALCFYYYDIRSTSDHQALDPSVWGPLLYMVSSIMVNIASR